VFTQWAGPPITTVRQPLTQMGRTAAELVIAIANGRPPENNRVELATNLVVRQSTAPPPAR
jgi:LacI family xylobiose transport system transcriptional regulator